MSLLVTVDKNDFVQKVERSPDSTSTRQIVPPRRFKRLRDISYRRRRLTMEQEQEICALYIDHPDMGIHQIARRFGLRSGGAVQHVVEAYGLPLRGRPVSSRRLGARMAEIAPVIPAIRVPANASSQSATKRHEASDERPTWRITTIRTVVEEIHADGLLDIAAHYDGQDVSIVKAEKV